MQVRALVVALEVSWNGAFKIELTGGEENGFPEMRLHVGRHTRKCTQRQHPKPLLTIQVDVATGFIGGL